MYFKQRIDNRHSLMNHLKSILLGFLLLFVQLRSLLITSSMLLLSGVYRILKFIC